MKPRELRRAIERVANAAGASAAFEYAGVHIKVTLTYRGRSRFVTISGTPSKTYAIDEMIADVRRTLRELGCAKPAKPKAAKIKTWRPQVVAGTMSEPVPVVAGPRYRPNDDLYLNGMGATLAQLKRRMAS